MTEYTKRIAEFYEENELKVDISFFLGGFLFDVFTLSAIDDLWSIAQQIAYLLILGGLLYYDFLYTHKEFEPPSPLKKVWDYRQLAVHFLLGSLLSVYSLFYLKSASLFSSIVFVALIMVIMVANELKKVQESAINVKIGLYVVCIFSFFSMLIPVVLGFVGLLPFLLAIAATGGTLYGAFRLLQHKIQDPSYLRKSLMAPGAAVLGLFIVFYFIGWIPPVPLSIQNMGIYHSVEKSESKYILSHEKSPWLFWHRGDQNFLAEPGDKIYFFAEIFSPARFSDAVILHWYFKDPLHGWKTTDKIPMNITGGRKNGYRGFASKQNYSAGEWRISVETTDGREIGRIYFDVVKIDSNSPARVFKKEIY